MTHFEGRCFGLLLAGGLSRRMGGVDKAFLLFGGTPLVEHVLRRFAPQCERVAISANGALERFERLGLPVLRDPMPGHPGPLAGLLAGLGWAAREPEVAGIVSVAVDMPLIPLDLVTRLRSASRGGRAPVSAASGGSDHPVAAYWPIGLRSAIEQALAAGRGRVADVLRRSGGDRVEWPSEPVDPFLNLNTPEDIAAAEARLSPGRPCGS